MSGSTVLPTALLCLAGALAVLWSVCHRGREGPGTFESVRLLSGGQLALGRRGRGKGKRLRHGCFTRSGLRDEAGAARPLLYRWPTAAGAGAGVALLVGGATGAALGVLVGTGLRVWQRSSGDTDVRDGRQGVNGRRVREQLPIVADLLAACLEAGAGVCEAADAVGRSVDDPVGPMLLRAAAELRLGADPEGCWTRFGTEPGAAALGRCLERACRSGASPASQVAGLAAECRAAHTRAGLLRARRAGVLSTAPVGLCFLPAFLLMGVVPTVLGLAGAILGPA